MIQKEGRLMEHGSWLCQMSGVPASGKSTVVRLICAEGGAVAVDLDVIKSALLPSFDKGVNHRRVGAMAYDVVFALAGYYLGLGCNVVIDTPGAYTAVLERGMAAARQYGAKYKYVECMLPCLEELNHRRTTRPVMASQILTVPLDDSEYQTELARTVRPKDIPTLAIDTSKPLAGNRDMLINYLSM